MNERISYLLDFKVDKNCFLMGYHAVGNGNFLTKFRATYRPHLQRSRIHPWPLNMGPIGCHETSIRNYQYTLRNDPEESSSGISELVNRRNYTGDKICKFVPIPAQQCSESVSKMVFMHVRAYVRVLCRSEVHFRPAQDAATDTEWQATRGCIDTISLSWWWARCARNM